MAKNEFNPIWLILIVLIIIISFTFTFIMISNKVILLPNSIKNQLLEEKIKAEPYETAFCLDYVRILNFIFINNFRDAEINYSIILPEKNQIMFSCNIDEIFTHTHMESCEPSEADLEIIGNEDIYLDAIVCPNKVIFYGGLNG